MKMDDPKYARSLERREARARRSNKLGRLLFGCLAVGITLTIRLNPAVVTDIGTYFASTSGTSKTRMLPGVQPVSQMPLNKVTVRKGIGSRTTTSSLDSQAMAQDLGQQLGQIKVGH